MDKSKLPKLTKKSSETPWSQGHENKRLETRGGVKTHGWGGYQRSWVEKEKDRLDWGFSPGLSQKVKRVR